MNESPDEGDIEVDDEVFDQGGMALVVPSTGKSKFVRLEERSVELVYGIAN